MAVRMTTDTIRTLQAINYVTKDMKYRSQSSNYKSKPQETCKVSKFRQMSSRSFKDSIPYETSATKTMKETQKQNSISSDNALVHKVHPNDRPLRNNVPEREKCTELNDILAKWNIYVPKK